MGGDPAAGHPRAPGGTGPIAARSRAETRRLRELARRHGVLTSYKDLGGVRREASDDALRAVLNALGASGVEPSRARVHVAWDGRLDGGSGRIVLESGEEHRDGEPLPHGYHRLHDRQGESLVISAPTRCYRGDVDREWGVFLPLYALRTERNWGAGDLTDLRALLNWTEEVGGDVVGTLPMLAAFLDDPFDPSPYAPVSRLFWNELYVDVERAPELERSPEARKLLRSKRFREDVAAARRKRHVDYRLVASLKRRVLERLAQVGDVRMERGRRKEIEDYGRFRAAVERLGPDWHDWPSAQRNGRLRNGDVDPDVVQYHVYVQALAQQQLAELDRRAEGGDALFLDLPLGVHADGYDTWRFRDAFAIGVTAGAPPDDFFSEGQDWGSPPLNPTKIREQDYAYPIAALRHLMRHASVLRIDHVMWMHRLFWVPDGMEPRDGVYVRSPHEELYAILSLESHRAKTAIVGEDLGTVPKEVRLAMRTHGVRRSCVLQYELRLEGTAPLGRVPRESQASLNTHDMTPFAALWAGLDIDDRVDLGLLDDREARQERARRRKLMKALTEFVRREGTLGPRTGDGHEVMVAAQRYLARSDARTVLVNLEDLWGETRPQNTPGTQEERPNWVRKARHPFERFREMPGVLGTLQDVNSLRKAKR